MGPVWSQGIEVLTNPCRAVPEQFKPSVTGCTMPWPMGILFARGCAEIPHAWTPREEDTMFPPLSFFYVAGGSVIRGRSPTSKRVLIEQVRMGIYEHRCCALASRLLVDLAARHPRRRDVHARPGKDGRCTRGTRARKMDTGKWGGRTPISRGVWDRGPEMRPAGAALPFALSHLCRAALQTECPDEASVPDDRDDGQSERWSTF